MSRFGLSEVDEIKLQQLRDDVDLLTKQVETLTGFVREVCDQTNEQWQRINSLNETIERHGWTPKR